MEPVGFSETSTINYCYYTLHEILKECRADSHRRGSLKSQLIYHDVMYFEGPHISNLDLRCIAYLDMMATEVHRDLCIHSVVYVLYL